MMSILAVYENGVLRPSEPLELAEGQSVQLSVYSIPTDHPLRPRTPEEQDYCHRLQSAKTMAEMMAVIETAPPSPDGDYDIGKTINESRRLTGFRMPDPEPVNGESL